MSVTQIQFSQRAVMDSLESGRLFVLLRESKLLCAHREMVSDTDALPLSVTQATFLDGGNMGRSLQEDIVSKDRDVSIEHYGIGLKLRTLRMEKRLTLARLGGETGLSTALLCKLESGRMIPTFHTLSKICRVYGVSFSYFFSEPTKHTLAISRRGHFIPLRSSQETVRRIPLHHNPIGAAQCRASMVEFPENLIVAASGPEDPLSCVVYVIEGKLQMEVGGVRELLEPGDCACIETDMTITWGAASPDRCRALLVNASARQTANLAGVTLNQQGMTGP